MFQLKYIAIGSAVLALLAACYSTAGMNSGALTVGGGRNTNSIVTAGVLLLGASPPVGLAIGYEL